ncbi:hypothetical protein ABC347_08905 [Sphingomonas sp. 1P06PA]|uniref:hypothetical protein n=1 Tax=Sphingomonas sp. 1P06PA TaxID=554121 RepID=UPI0039A6499E
MTDTHKMQADGGGTDKARDRKPASGHDAAGESGGGAYPNPHDEGRSFEEHGQAGGGYHGPGQLGGEKADADEEGRVGQGG